MRKPKIATQYPGVRYREHDTRKHGVRYDKYFSIRYRVNGKLKEEGVGWASSGMTAEKASKILSEIRENIRTGKGPLSLSAMREENIAKKIAKKEAEEMKIKSAICFGEFFENSYFPTAKINKKPESMVSELALYRKWISPVIKDIPLREICYSHIEEIIKNMNDNSLAKRSIKYALSVISQVWTYARDKDVINTESPTKKFPIGTLDNERTRFLTKDEAKSLIDELGKHSIDVRDMATLSLLCGLRAGEIFKLKWSDVDLENETILLRGTKSGKSRYAYIVKDVKSMLIERKKRMVNIDDHVFPTSSGVLRTRVSKTFRKVVKSLGFNDGIDDRRQHVVFHTLRHTFASWLAQHGTSLFSVQNLMGHSEYRMTQRYAHLSPDGMRRDVKILDDMLDDGKSKEKSANILYFKKAK